MLDNTQPSGESLGQDKNNVDANKTRDLANKAHSALTWCIEEIGKTVGEQEDINPEHIEKIDEINRLIAELADSIYSEKEAQSNPCMPVQQMAFTLADGRQFKVKRLL